MMKQMTTKQVEEANGIEQFVLDEAAWTEVAGGKIHEHFHGCPEIDNVPKAPAK